MQDRLLSTFLCSVVVVGFAFAVPADNLPENSANSVNLPANSQNSAANSQNSQATQSNSNANSNAEQATQDAGQNANATQSQQNSQGVLGVIGNIFGVGDSPSVPDDDIKTYELGAVEITAPEYADSNPTVVSISSDDLEHTGARDAAEAFRFTPNVFYMPSNQRSSTIYIRGFSESDLGFYYDGIPINDIYQGNAVGGTDLAPYASFGISELQVSKGYTSPVFSTNKRGGALNIVSYTPRKNLEFRLRLVTAANNERQMGAQIGRHFGDSYFALTYTEMKRDSLHYSYRHDELGPIEIPNTDKRYYMISGKYGIYFGYNHEYSANFYHQHQKRHIGLAYGDGLPFYDKTAFYVLGDSVFNDYVSLNSRIWYHMDASQSGAWSQYSALYDNYSIGINEVAKFSFGIDQNMKLGFTVKNEHHYAEDVIKNGGAADRTRYYPEDREWDVLNSSFFTEYALRMNSMFRFVLSASYDRHDGIRILNRPYYNQESGNASDILKAHETPLSKDKNRHLWGWTAQGILYMQPVEPLVFHANLGRKINIPKINALYSTLGATAGLARDLTPERVLNYELGVDFKHEFKDFGTSSFGATGFFHDISNMITTQQLPKDRCTNPTQNATTDVCIFYMNADQGYSYGGEIYAKQGFFNDKLTLGATWSYVQRRTKRYYTDENRQFLVQDNRQIREWDDFTTHPRSNGTVSITLTPRNEFDVALNGTYQSSRYVLVNNVRELGNASLPAVRWWYEKTKPIIYFDLVANYWLTKRFKVTAGAYNVFDINYGYNDAQDPSQDTEYVRAYAESGGLPGRSIFAGFEYRYGE